MSYTALYRKWRPQRFDQVKGQTAVVSTLQNQIKLGKIGHAYLFCGSRGTGKTSVAKIFAKAVNCENPVDGEPCGCCATCRAIDAGKSMNVFEMDAASNNGVDHVRELLEEIQYPPTEGKYRVYIVDEVHMFSTSAFNAFLKTLEEPPAYVIFILATTEPHKIPATIISRCQEYDFRRIDGATIKERLAELCEGEGLKVSDKALSFIARKADGGMRDAISLLDQAATGVSGELKFEDVLKSIGAVDNEIFGRFVSLLTDKDAPALLSLIDEMVMSGKEIGQFAQDLAWYLRNLLLVKSVPNDRSIVDGSDEDIARLEQEAERLSSEEIMRFIYIYSECYNDMRNAISKRVLFEVATLRCMRPEAQTDTESLLARISALEEQIKSGVRVAGRSRRALAGQMQDDPEVERRMIYAEDTNELPFDVPAPSFDTPEVIEPEAMVVAPEQIAAPVGFDWEAVLAETTPLVRNSIKNITPVCKGDMIELYCRDNFEKQSAEHFELEELVKKVTGKSAKLIVGGAPQQESTPKAEEAFAQKEEENDIAKLASSVFGNIEIKIE